MAEWYVIPLCHWNQCCCNYLSSFFRRQEANGLNKSVCLSLTAINTYLVMKKISNPALRPSVHAVSKVSSLRALVLQQLKSLLPNTLLILHLHFNKKQRAGVILQTIIRLGNIVCRRYLKTTLWHKDVNKGGFNWYK